MRVRVTDRHIATGKVRDEERCPIVLALIDMGFENVLVQPTRILIGKEGYALLKEA